MGVENPVLRGNIVIDLLDRNYRSSEVLISTKRVNPEMTDSQLFWRKVLRPFMRALAHNKQTNWFNWYKFPEGIELDGIDIPGDHNAFRTDHRNPAIRTLQNIHMSLGGWKTSRLLGLDLDKLTPEQRHVGWRYWYSIPYTGDTSYCNLIIPSDAAIRILVGPDRFRVGAIAGNSFQVLPVVEAGPFTRELAPIL